MTSVMPPNPAACFSMRIAGASEASEGAQGCTAGHCTAAGGSTLLGAAGAGLRSFLEAQVTAGRDSGSAKQRKQLGVHAQPQS